MPANPNIDTPNYRAEQVTAERWRRAKRVLIDNPLGGEAVVAFDEEEITVLEGKTTARPTATLNVTVDPLAEIHMRDPITGALTGTTVTHGFVYAVLYSLYRQLGEIRDAEEGA